jgi:hypothetical protein
LIRRAIIESQERGSSAVWVPFCMKCVTHILEFGDALTQAAKLGLIIEENEDMDLPGRIWPTLSKKRAIILNF